MAELELSSRQRDFLRRLFDLYRQAEEPVHYAEVAEALDVNPVTAYEMLRLLEDKGFARSEAVRPEGHRGRSLIAFAPTERARGMLVELGGGSTDEQAWEEAKENILQALEEGRGGDYRQLLDELLLRLPERRSPLLFATDMITVIILVFYELRDRAVAKRVFSHLRLFGPPGLAVLYSLAGFSLALSLVEKANRRATSLLLSYAQQFREHLDGLTGGEKVRLSEFVYEVLQALGL